MKILSITTATNHLSVALNDGDKILEKNEEDHRNHSEHLDPLINELFFVLSRIYQHSYFPFL